MQKGQKTALTRSLERDWERRMAAGGLHLCAVCLLMDHRMETAICFGEEIVISSVMKAAAKLYRSAPTRRGPVILEHTDLGVIVSPQVLLLAIAVILIAPTEAYR